MQRVLTAIGAAVVLAAAVLGYLLLGGEEPATPVAEGPDDAASPAVTQQAAAPEPSDQSAPPAVPPAASKAASETPAAAAQAPDQQAPDQQATDPQAAAQPVIRIKPREPAAPATPAPEAPAGTTAEIQDQARQQAQSTAEAPAATPAPSAQPDSAAPSFDVVRVEKSGDTVIAGRAEPDSEVNVKTQSGETIGKARADGSGSWAIVAETPLAPGSHEIGIEAQDSAGETHLSKDVVVVVVPEPAAASAPSGPSASSTAATPASETQVLAVLTPREGSGPSKVVQQPESGDGIAQGDLVLDSVDYDEEGRVTVGGRAAPGSRVLLYLDNRLVGDAISGDGGRWSHAPEQPVAEGLHSLRVDQVDPDGNVLARVETPFSREAVRVAEATEDFVIVQPGNSLWRIARSSYGRGIRYTVIYQANRDQIRDPDLIYPGQVFEIPKSR